MQVGAKQAVEKVEHSRRFVFTRRRVVISLSALVLLIVAGIAILWWWQSYTAQAMRLLVRKFSDQRTVEGRLAGGFKGGRFVPPTADDTLLQSPEIIDASRLLDKAIAANDAGARLVYARLLLLTNEKAPATLKAFQQAVETQPASAAAINDLGVCLLAHNQLEDALTKFDEALKQQPEMPEALFNRALCYQQLQLRDAASADFARLLEIKDDRSWRDEIRQRHQDVSAAIAPQKKIEEKEVAEAFDRAFAAEDIEAAGRVVDDNLSWALRYAYDDCSSEFLKAAALGEAEASARELSKIRLIGERLAAVAGDKSYLDLTSYLQGLSRQDAANQLTLVREYLECEHLPSTKIAMQRQDDLQKLRVRFKESGNQLFEFLSTYLPGYLDFSSNLFSSSLPKMREALKIAESCKWPYLRAFMLVQMGNICTRLGRDSLALDYCHQAIPVGREIPYVEFKATQYMANACWHLGDFSQGLLYLRRSSDLSLTKLPSLPDLASNMLQAADCYRLIDNHKLALLYARQALSYAEAGEIEPRLAQTESFIAVELAERNQAADSAAAIQRAFASLEKIPVDDSPYSHMLVRLRAGDLASRQGKLQQAEQHFAQAQAIAEKGEEKELPLIKILKARAASYARAGQPKRASADLNHAIALIEAYRNNISERSNRSDFFDASQDVFDQMIQLQARAFGQMDKAFNISEQARARTLLDDITSSSAAANQTSQAATPPAPVSVAALTLDKIRAALPKDLTLISYSVTSGGTLIFVVRRDDFIAVKSDVSTEKLDQLVQDYVAGLNEQAPIEKLAEQSRQLYQLLIAPVEAKLGTENRLCIAPDKALHQLPFDALIDAAGNYLIESHVLTSVPSASTLVYCLEQAQRKNAVVDEKLLAIGNPLFSREHFPDLPPLPEAESEVHESALSYSHPTVLTGPQATKAQTLAELMNCDVAHFSTHCLVKEKTPWLAALVLAQASEDPDDELLRLNEFNKIGLLRARLVILSACQSGLGQYYRGEGIVSLVRPFLARSVPSVVASLWPVDSQATATLMIDFHRARKQNGRLAADALRTAQMQMIQSASFNHPYCWAPFVVVGSNN